MTQETDFKEFLEEKILKPALELYNKYQNIIIGIVGGIVLVVILAIMTITRLQQTQKRNWEKIAIAQAYLHNKMYSEGFKLLDEIISSSKRAKYSTYAMYTKSTFLFENNDFATAKDLCLKILEVNKPKSIIPHTLYLLGQCYQNLGDSKNAISTYNIFISKYATHYLTPRVYESLAVTYELVGDKENARNVYDKMNILYPGSYWSNLAQQKLNPTLANPTK